MFLIQGKRRYAATIATRRTCNEFRHLISKNSMRNIPLQVHTYSRHQMQSYCLLSATLVSVNTSALIRLTYRGFQSVGFFVEVNKFAKPVPRRKLIVESIDEAYSIFTIVLLVGSEKSRLQELFTEAALVDFVLAAYPRNETLI